ncbi:endonuclease/exonuclease/phosphatase family protein [Kaistella yonginensis]|uniref:endonuclease/exonuclease/phosphatase family protein n=1 Tax=Kaistella yonginensis TaxID=658267 RepID=UPI0025B3CE40|nr:endonuclease/exonuclease/phosphatase family protein [Kaistella yonginensis]MDN3605336.1 endonuclease/exonuclease/phosphatase family protein [Kaistella yonginensis]
MKKLIGLFTFLCFISAQAQSLKVMTYNIRLSLDSDKENSWTNRKSEALDLLNYYHPEVLGVQEAVPQQMVDIKKSLNHYDFVGVGRDDGNNKGEYSAIFYDTEKLKVVESGTFWLSETPNIPSKGWDAAYPRICTYALFKMKKGGKKFWAFNVHFDHIGNEARRNSASLILDKIKKINPRNFPVILTGDFNLTEETVPIQILSTNLNDCYKHSVKKPYGPKGTFTNFDTNTVPTQRIDYVFVKNMTCETYRAINDRRENLLYPSDHFPVLVELRF